MSVAARLAGVAAVLVPVVDVTTARPAVGGAPCGRMCRQRLTVG
jgi:hypothetical protein